MHYESSFGPIIICLLSNELGFFKSNVCRMRSGVIDLCDLSDTFVSFLYTPGVHIEFHVFMLSPNEESWFYYLYNV